MTGLEIDTGEQTPPRPFEQLDAVNGEGGYVFALDPNVQFKRIYKWAVFQTISGERPPWEETILNLIKRSEGIVYTTLSTKESKVSGREARWRDEEGHINFRGQNSKISVGRGFKNGLSIGNLTLVDALVVGETVQEEVGGGSLTLQLEGQDPALTLTNDALRWKGSLSVKGRPGKAIVAVIKGLNLLIQKNQYPLWKQV